MTFRYRRVVLAVAVAAALLAPARADDPKPKGERYALLERCVARPREVEGKRL